MDSSAPHNACHCWGCREEVWIDSTKWSGCREIHSEDFHQHRTTRYKT